MMALLKDKWVGYGVVLIVMCVLAGLGLGKAYSAGYGAAKAHYVAEIAADQAARAEADANEQRRQNIANNAAKKREADAIAKLEAKEAEELETRKRQRDEAAQDPDAGRIAIGSGGVQRLNKIR